MKDLEDIMFKRSTSFILGVDITENDDFTISVVRLEGNKMIYENTITGKEAKEFYEKLINNRRENNVKNQ